ncbi:uncharacterized protein LOC144173782 [Haemaphysalis longicornis]
MQDKRKNKTAGQNIALRLGITETDLAIQAGQLFFPQPPLGVNPRAPFLPRTTPPEMNTSLNDPFTMAELLSALQETKITSAPGPDGITYSALRNLPEAHKEQLLDWFNAIWESSVLPNEWKESWVVPIPKPGKPLTQIENLRPISLISNVMKLMESMVLARIQWHLETTGQLHPRQTGFRRHLSTLDSLKLLSEDVIANTSSCDPRLVVAIDVKKAFDSVLHEAVIQGARNRGLDGKPLAFVQDFLRDRHYRVRVGDTLGPKTANCVGVPQGSVLSPTLFNIVMADLPPLLDEIEGLRFTIYADDTTLWTKGGSIGEQEQAMQQGLNTISSFLTEVGLAPSPEKTVFVVVANKRLHKQNIKSQFKLTMNGVPIQERPSVRILGLDIDEDGGATTWLKKLTATWKSTLSLIPHPTRRQRKATTHLKELQRTDDYEGVHRIYTDAALQDDQVAIAWYCDKTKTKGAKALRGTPSVKEAELRALLLATEEAHRIAATSPTEAPTTFLLYTDSKEAVRECGKNNTRSRTVARIRAVARDLRQLGRILTIRWVPGHNGIPGNEEAHEAAREMLSNPDNCQKPPSRPTNVFPALQASTPPSLELLPDESEEEGYDYEEAIAKARAERRAALRLRLPEEDDPIPSGYNRWATVTLRRIRTNTAVTPHIMARFRLHPGDGTCKLCESPDSTQAACPANHAMRFKEWVPGGVPAVKR